MLSQSLWITMWTLCQWVWTMLCYTEPADGNHDVNAVPVGVNHGGLCWASGCESRVLCWANCCETMWMILRYWLWIIVSYAEPVVVNHCVLCRAGCVGIMVCYAEPVIGNDDVNAVPVVVNHSVFVCASRCEPWRVMRRQLFWIMLCYSVPVGVNHGELC